jgi:uncharacterized coiled-coil DUF342 family protein
METLRDEMINQQKRIEGLEQRIAELEKKVDAKQLTEDISSQILQAIKRLGSSLSPQSQ